MKYKIALVESDTYFASHLSRRLQKLIPSGNFLLYSPEVLKKDMTLSFSEDIILYNDDQTNEKEIKKHVGEKKSIPLISLYQSGRAGRHLLNGTELSEKILSALSSDISSKSGFMYEQKREKENVNRVFLSFSDMNSREGYIHRHIVPLLKNGTRILRLDIMPGILMPQYKETDETSEHIHHFTGISQLLLDVERESFRESDIPSYLQQGRDGIWRFGLPDRSDDLICCPLNILIRLLFFIRRFTEMEEEQTAFICVIESLPFQSLMDICPLFDELHLIQETQCEDQTSYGFEFNRIFRKMPSSSLRFVYKTQTIGTVK